MNIFHSISYKIKSRLNKGIINKLLVALGFEKHIKISDSFWKNYIVDNQKTEQEISGYSHISGIDATIIEVHKQLQSSVKKYFKPTPDLTILDIGCGPGLYLKDFAENITKYGVDLNENMLKLAKKNNPNAILIKGDFLKVDFPATFNMVYTVGVLQYFTPSELQRLLKKASSLLKEQGILFISYPHALTKEDLSFTDINYINYSPQYLNSIASKYFRILSNGHVLQNRTIDDYDRSPAIPPNGFDKTYQNSSIFIGQKK